MHFLCRTIVGAIILVYLFEEEEKSQHIFETHNFFINSHKIMSSFFMKPEILILEKMRRHNLPPYGIFDLASAKLSGKTMR